MTKIHPDFEPRTWLLHPRGARVTVREQHDTVDLIVHSNGTPPTSVAVILEAHEAWALQEALMSCALCVTDRVGRRENP